MREWKTWRIVLFISLCLCLNLGGKYLAYTLGLPLWADSFGTALCAYVGGPVCGALVGLSGNLAFTVINKLSFLYSITSIALGIIVGIAVRKKWFDQFYGFMKAASLTMFTALVVSVPVNLMINNGYTGNKWGDGVFDYLHDKDWPLLVCAVLGQLAIEFMDKVLTIALVYIVIRIKKARDEEESDKKIRNGTAVGTALILCLSLGMSMPIDVRAEDVTTSSVSTDYNDYVQSIYSSNNGLPCGEANDIAQTNDGVLWIGTYAGL